MGEEQYCEVCGAELEWEECAACGGSGGYDAYEDDMELCGECGGAGGSLFCPNAGDEQHRLAWQAKRAARSGGGRWTNGTNVLSSS